MLNDRSRHCMTTTHSGPDQPRVQQLRDEGITAFRAGDSARSRTLLLQAIDLNPSDIQSWLWLSASVANDAERRFCMEQVLAIDPSNQVAQRGLARLPAER